MPFEELRHTHRDIPAEVRSNAAEIVVGGAPGTLTCSGLAFAVGTLTATVAPAPHIGRGQG